MDLAEAVFVLTKSFPPTEQYGLTSQARRAAISVPANIAEGNGRETSGYYVQALRVAQGSLKELETHLLLAVRFDFATNEVTAPILQRCDEVGRMLRALIRAVQDRSG